jgi:hypothetical protein
MAWAHTVSDVDCQARALEDELWRNDERQAVLMMQDRPWSNSYGDVGADEAGSPRHSLVDFDP